MPSYITIAMASRVPVKHVVSAPKSNGGSYSAAAPHQGGNGSISGRVLENGIPVSRRVMLYDRKTGAYAGQVRSDADGNYTFKRTNEALVYFIVSVDDSNDGVQYNLVGQDLISGNHDKKVAT